MRELLAVIGRLDRLVLRHRLRMLCALVWASACAPRPDDAAAEAEPAPTLAIESPTMRPIAGELGTAHPVTIQGVAPTGHWLAICQARADTDGDGRIYVRIGEHGDVGGDEMKAYLVRTAGPGEPIEAFVGSDPTGRHVAVVKDGGRVVLLDTWNDSELVIPRADATDDPNPAGPHRAVSFDAGRHAAWAEREGGKSRVVVRDLAAGSERRIDAGATPLWRFELDASGRWLWLWTIDTDSNGDGELAIPRAMTSLGDRFCRGEVAVSGHYGWSGDVATRKVAHVVDGAVARSASGALGVLGGALLVRMPDGSIVRHDDDGEHVLVPADCAARVVHADEPSKSLWVVCTAEAHAQLNWSYAPLHRYGFADHEAFPLTFRVDDQDVWTRGDTMLYTVEKVFVNLTTGTVGRPFGKRTHVFWEDSVVFDTSRSAAPEPVVVETRGVPLAYAPGGEVLVAAGNGGFGVAIQGPLTWLPPP